MKKKLIAFLLAICLFFPPLLSACSLFGGSGDSSQDATTETVPTLTIIEDAKLAKNDRTGWYNITMDANESYKINISLGDYQGSKYYVVFDLSTGEDKVELSSDGTITAKEHSSTSWAYIHVGLKEKGKSSYWVNRKYETIVVQIKPSTTVVENVTLTFAKDSGMKYDKTNTIANWFFNIPQDETFKLQPIISGLSNYTIEYEAMYNRLAVSAEGVVSVADISSGNKYDYIYLKVRSSDGLVKNFTVLGVVDGTDEGDNLDYLEARLTLPLVDPETDGGRIEITAMGYDNCDYRLKVPYEYNYYDIPDVTLSGYTGSYYLFYEAAPGYEGKIGSKQNENTNKVAVAATNAYARLAISAETAPNHTGDVIDVIYVSIVFSRVGEGEFTFQNYDTHEDYVSEQNIDLLTNETIKLMPLFNHYSSRSRTDSSKYKISYQISNDIIAFEGFTNAFHGFTAVAAGTTKLTYTLVESDSAGTEFTYTFVFNITVTARTLENIFVAHPEMIRISDNSVAINGKIFAQYTGNYLVAINNKSGLTYEISDVDVTTKHIKFTYNDGTTTKTCEYDVDLSQEFEYTKTALTTTYRDHWNTRNFACTQSSGEVKVLIIPVWFTNSEIFFDSTKQDSAGKTQQQQIIEDLNLTHAGESERTMYKTLEEYYEEESYGKMDMQITVSDEWCPLDTASTDHKYHGQENVVVDTREVASFAVNWYFNSTHKTLDEFDGNDDGIIDAVMIYYGAYYVGNPSTEEEQKQAGRAYVGRGWSTTYALSQEYGFTNYSFISCFSIYSAQSQASTTEMKKIKSQNDLSNCGFATDTTIHEFGHILGLYDLYDTVNDSQIFPAGAATMQDSDRAGHDPYSVMSLGWTNPYVFDSSDTTLDDQITITINDFQSSGDLILLTNAWNNTDTVFDEYILIELYTLTGLNANDTSATGAGIRIWHVNATLAADGSHQYKNDSAVGSNDNLVKNLVHYIRNDKTSVYGRGAARISDQTMFHEGDVFSVEEYNSQFIEDGVMDNGIALGWQVSIGQIVVDAAGNATATITLNK